MSGFHNRKAQDLKKPFPGCIGRMINVFDFSAGVAGNKMLTERAHGDGTSLGFLFMFIYSDESIMNILFPDLLLV